MSNKKQQDLAAAQMKAFKDLQDKGGFDIDDRQYRFAKMPFKIGKKIFSYMTAIAGEIENGMYSFIDTSKFEDEIEPLLMQYTLFDGHKLDTLEGHFEEFPHDYVQFVATSIQGFAAPFLSGNGTNSRSTETEKVQVLSRKRT